MKKAIGIVMETLWMISKISIITAIRIIFKICKIMHTFQYLNILFMLTLQLPQ